MRGSGHTTQPSNQASQPRQVSEKISIHVYGICCSNEYGLVRPTEFPKLHLTERSRQERVQNACSITANDGACCCVVDVVGVVVVDNHPVNLHHLCIRLRTESNALALTPAIGYQCVPGEVSQFAKTRLHGYTEKSSRTLTKKVWGFV